MLIFTACNGGEPLNSEDDANNNSQTVENSENQDNANNDTEAIEDSYTLGKDFGYDRLDEFQQEIYDMFKYGLISPDEPYMLEESIDQVYGMIPLALYEGNYETLYSFTNDYHYILPQNSTTEIIGYMANPPLDEAQRAEQFTELNKKADEIVSLIPENATDYEKIKFIAQYLADNVVYTPNEVDYDIITESSNAYGALINNYAICGGYANAFQILAEKAGVVSIVIRGQIYSAYEAHIWNMVYVDNNWYHIDATWIDNPYTGFDDTYLMATDSEMSVSHYDFSLVNTLSAEDFPIFTPPVADTIFPNK